jgi:hypothetical protein
LVFSHKEELNYVIFRKTDGTGDHHVKWNKTDSERQIPHIFYHMQNLVPQIQTINKIWT